MMMIPSELIEIIFSYLSFKDRYLYALTCKYLFSIFERAKHSEIIEIPKKQHKLTQKWKNIKFQILLSKG